MQEVLGKLGEPRFGRDGVREIQLLLAVHFALAAFAVVARIRTVFADKGYDAESNRTLCRRFGAEPHIHKRKQPSGSGLGQKRWPVERSNAWLLENKRLALRYDRLGFIVQALLQTACMLLVAGRLARELRQPPFRLGAIQGPRYPAPPSPFATVAGARRPRRCGARAAAPAPPRAPPPGG